MLQHRKYIHPIHELICRYIGEGKSSFLGITKPTRVPRAKMTPRLRKTRSFDDVYRTMFPGSIVASLFATLVEDDELDVLESVDGKRCITEDSLVDKRGVDIWLSAGDDEMGFFNISSTTISTTSSCLYYVSIRRWC